MQKKLSQSKTYVRFTEKYNHISGVTVLLYICETNISYIIKTENIKIFLGCIHVSE